MAETAKLPDLFEALLGELTAGERGTLEELRGADQRAGPLSAGDGNGASAPLRTDRSAKNCFHSCAAIRCTPPSRS